MIDNRIEELVAQYLRREIQLPDFQDHFAPLYAQARRYRIPSRLSDLVVLPLAEVLRGHRNESSFRTELRKIAQPWQVVEKVAPGSMSVEAEARAAGQIVRTFCRTPQTSATALRLVAPVSLAPAV